MFELKWNFRNWTYFEHQVMLLVEGHLERMYK